jgi:uncharacterized membrane protein YphA (DoxX/SURF4 family)
MQDSQGINSGIGLREYLFEPRIARTPEAGRPGDRSRLFNPYLLLAFRLVLAGVFLYAAFQKIGKPLAFADEIRMYGILDIGALLYITAIVLPWVELLCGVSLLTGIFLRGTAFILLILNAVFLVAVSIRTAGVMSEEGLAFTKVYFDCGCGFGATYAWKKLTEDAFFFLFSLVLFLAPAYRFVLVPTRRRQ